jgi:hypothetical protein
VQLRQARWMRQDAPRPIANAVKLLLLREEAKKRQGAQTDLSQTLRSNDHNVSGGVDAIAGRLMGVSERQTARGLKPVWTHRKGDAR